MCSSYGSLWSIHTHRSLIYKYKTLDHIGMYSLLCIVCFGSVFVFVYLVIKSPMGEANFRKGLLLEDLMRFGFERL